MIIFSLLAQISLSIALAQTSVPRLPLRFEIEDKSGQKIEMVSLNLLGSDGKQVALNSLFKQKPVIISPVFYKCPDICGLVLNGLLDGLKEIDFLPGRDFEIVTFSIDPNEKSELANSKRNNVLASLQQVKPSSDWSFFTADEESIRKLSEQLGFKYKYIPETGLYSHAPGIFILNSEGLISTSVADVIYPKDILEYALIKASQGKLGSTRQKVKFYFLDYDFSKNELRFDFSKGSIVVFLFALLSTLALMKIKKRLGKSYER